ncbi:hypothetical protein TURU_125738 [Turdus rufiventris]|nr:hypothetical protein TURU_125738 [Turdus rufiventris]
MQKEKRIPADNLSAGRQGEFKCKAAEQSTERKMKESEAITDNGIIDGQGCPTQVAQSLSDLQDSLEKVTILGPVGILSMNLTRNFTHISADLVFYL